MRRGKEKEKERGHWMGRVGPDQAWEKIDVLAAIPLLLVTLALNMRVSRTSDWRSST